MARWFLGLLLILNLGLFLWGSRYDRPLDPPLPPLPPAPGQILLPAEWAGRDVAVTIRSEPDPPPPGPSAGADKGPFDPDPAEGSGEEPLRDESGLEAPVPLPLD